MTFLNTVIQRAVRVRDPKAQEFGFICRFRAQPAPERGSQQPGERSGQQELQSAEQLPRILQLQP